jgi:hypothetical protein
MTTGVRRVAYRAAYLGDTVLTGPEHRELPDTVFGSDYGG